MKRSTVGILVAIVAVIAIVAVVMMHNNKDDKKDVDKHASMGMQSNNNSTGTATSDKVTIQDFSFGPATTTVKKGTTVTWTNNDSAPHTVTGSNGKGPQSGNLSKGDTYQYTFDEVGTFDYICSIHPSMTAKVVVTE
jgi:plastocyanin